MLRIFFDEPDEIDVTDESDIPTEEEVEAVISEYQSPTGSFVYFEDSWHDSLHEILTGD